MQSKSEEIKVVKWVALWTVLAVVLAPVAYVLLMSVLWSLEI